MLEFVLRGQFRKLLDFFKQFRMHNVICDPYNKFSYAVLLSHDLPKVTRLLFNHARSTDVDRISHAVEVIRNKFFTYPVYNYFKRFVIFVCLLFFLFCFRIYVHRVPHLLP